MNILIKGMEMPKNGSCIQIVIDDDGKVYPSVEKCILKMGSIANAAPVPPHGRLIDADALTAKFKEMGLGEHSLIERLFADGVYVMIDYAPAIIPEDEVV